MIFFPLLDPNTWIFALRLAAGKMCSQHAARAEFKDFLINMKAWRLRQNFLFSFIFWFQLCLFSSSINNKKLSNGNFFRRFWMTQTGHAKWS
jgi:hypothetical protein